MSRRKVPAELSEKIARNLVAAKIDESVDNNKRFSFYKPVKESLLIEKDIPDQDFFTSNEVEKKSIVQKPLIQSTDDILDYILNSLESLKVKDLKLVHDKSKEILEEYFKELQEVIEKPTQTRRRRSKGTV